MNVQKTSNTKKQKVIVVYYIDLLDSIDVTDEEQLELLLETLNNRIHTLANQ